MGFIALEKSRRTVCCGCLVEMGLEPSSPGCRRPGIFRLPGVVDSVLQLLGKQPTVQPCSLLAKPPCLNLEKKNRSGEKYLTSQEDFLLFSEGFIMFL